jgi:hypothetical protein
VRRLGHAEARGPLMKGSLTVLPIRKIASEMARVKLHGFHAGLRRDRLQTESSGRSFRNSSMNDFPIREDPPVMETAERFFIAAPGADLTAFGSIYSRTEPAPPA